MLSSASPLRTHIASGVSCKSLGMSSVLLVKPPMSWLVGGGENENRMEVDVVIATISLTNWRCLARFQWLCLARAHVPCANA
eukprot:4515501-Pleurochrysis_carterae.AAC.1